MQYGMLIYNMGRQGIISSELVKVKAVVGTVRKEGRNEERAIDSRQPWLN
jgi:hypothetical protein